jgi:hypothetical protein
MKLRWMGAVDGAAGMQRNLELVKTARCHRIRNRLMVDAYMGWNRNTLNAWCLC